MIETHKMVPLRWLLFTAALLLMGLSALPAEAAAPVVITVEGEPVPGDVPPVIVDGHMLVSVRFVSEALGAEVLWDPEQRQVTVTQGGTTVVLTLDQPEALVNGQTVPLAVPAQLIQDRTMVPVRFIAEALGATVEWDPDTRTANITRRAAAITGLAYLRDTGETRVVLTLSEPVASVTAEEGRNQVALTLSPAEIQVEQPARAIYDSLMKTVHLEADGRTVRLVANLWRTPSYRYERSPDGTRLVVTFAHTVTGIHFHRDGIVPLVSIAATGKLNYTAFTLREPDRLVLDLVGAQMDPRVETALEPGQPYLTRIRSAVHRGDFEGVRVVLELDPTVPYELISTDMGLQVRFIPAITSFAAERLEGRTRLTFAGTLPMDAQVALPEGKRELRLRVPQTRLALKQQVYELGDGTVDAVSLTHTPDRDETIITVALPYYLGHRVVSRGQSGQIIVDVVTSPVYGKRIWVDAGHGQVPGGRDDPGAVGETYGIYEKEVNLQVALALQKKLEAAGAVVFMTRTGDEGIDFRERPDRVNALQPPVDLFVSIHHNSAPRSTARGTETYFWPVHPSSRAAAEAIHAAVLEALGFPDRKVRQEPFYVIREVTAPTVLVELGYLSNPEEERAIAEPGAAVKTYPDRAAEGLLQGILDFFRQEIQRSNAN